MQIPAACRLILTYVVATCTCTFLRSVSADGHRLHVNLFNFPVHGTVYNDLTTGRGRALSQYSAVIFTTPNNIILTASIYKLSLLSISLNRVWW